MKTLTASELNYLVIKIFEYIDEDNKTYYKNIFGNYDMTLVFSDMVIRFIEEKHGDSRIRINYLDEMHQPQYIAYQKLPTAEKKKLVDRIFHTQFELCKFSENDFWCVQEINADKTSLEYMAGNDTSCYIIEKKPPMAFDILIDDNDDMFYEDNY